MGAPQIDPNSLSDSCKSFIKRFSKISQSKYDTVVKKVETSPKPVTVDHVEYMIR